MRYPQPAQAAAVHSHPASDQAGYHLSGHPPGVTGAAASAVGQPPEPSPEAPERPGTVSDTEPRPFCNGLYRRKLRCGELIIRRPVVQSIPAHEFESIPATMSHLFRRVRVGGSPPGIGCVGRPPSGGSVACTLLIGGERRSASREAVVDDRHVLRSEGLFFLLIHEQWLEELLGTGLTTNEDQMLLGIARLLAPAGCGRDGEAESGSLAAAHLQLVPEHQELDVPFVRRTTSRSKEVEKEEIEEREQHGSPSNRGERMLSVPVGRRIRDFEPFKHELLRD